MKTRRSFIKTVGTGAALSSVALSSTTAFASQMLSDSDHQQKRIRIGIIGAENSHTIGYGKMFNTDKKFPGVEVKYVWGETDEFAKNAAEKGNIPNIVKDPSEM
ncbi:MAG: twin-arginine translocation signal domain-containing protein, partial [Cyclobacteriaceae bacterium]|nr:twin-arginine translocation signal domain-containing protein [Cyclobacteriaceae bacterium]